MWRTLIIACLTLASVIPPAAASVLERIGETNTVRLGYRVDAPPFSYENEVGEPAGYAVDLCREVVSHMKGQLGLATIRIDYVPVTAENRFEAVRDGEVDLLCGPTTHTLGRREQVDFSIQTFIDGASVLFRADGPQSFAELAGRKIGVRAGTTTETALINTLESLQVDAEIVSVKSHYDGIERLTTGQIGAYFGDWAILLHLMASAETVEGLRLSDRQFTHEPYALALPRGDADFRLAVDRALARIYRSRRIDRIFRAHFGDAKPSDLLRALILINQIPE